MNIFRDRIHMTIAKGKIEYHTYKRLVGKKKTTKIGKCGHTREKKMWMILYDGTIGETTGDDANKIEPNELKPKLNLSTHTHTYTHTRKQSEEEEIVPKIVHTHHKKRKSEQKEFNAIHNNNNITTKQTSHTVDASSPRMIDLRAHIATCDASVDGCSSSMRLTRLRDATYV